MTTRLSNKPLLLDELSHPQVKALLDGGMDMVILPVGAVEQHSLHLPLNVDYLLAQELARAVSAVTGVPVLPALPYGHSSNHRGFHGNYSLRPDTFQKVVEELCDWMHAEGFRRVLFLNGNLPNQFPLQCAIANVGTRYGDLRLRALNWWDINPELRAWFATDESFGRCHANVAETALMLHLRPDLVDMSKTYPMPGKGVRPFFHYPHAAVSRDGHQGDPSQATAEMGRRMFELAVSSLSDQVKAALTESASDLERARS
jgi:creatinine amidohydrolase